MPSELHMRDEILSARAEIPDNVVYRSFVAETVILNLNTGQYHGINTSASFMLELLRESESVEQAAAALAKQHGLALREAANDLCDFCLELEQRGLIILSSPH